MKKESEKHEKTQYFHGKRNVLNVINTTNIIIFIILVILHNVFWTTQNIFELNKLMKSTHNYCWFRLDDVFL